MFLIIFFLLYALLHLYIFDVIVSAVGLPGTARALLVLLFVVMMILPWVTRRLERARHETAARLSAWAGYGWMGAAFVFAFISLLVRGISAAMRAMNQQAVHVMTTHHVFVVSAAITVLIVAYAFIERSWVRVERVIIPTDKDLGGRPVVRVAQISDVHIGLMNGAGRVRAIIRRLQQCDADVVVSTGDLIDSNLESQTGIAELFQEIQPSGGKYAILGNHECYAGLARSIRFTERAGFTMLRNQRAEVGGLEIAGLDDPAADWHADWEQREQQLLAPTSGRFTLFLKHRPDLMKSGPLRFDLQLSGHTHKGQIFPFSLLTRLQYPAHAGLFQMGQAYLYVSRGTGAWGPPLRFLAPPEITLIEIRQRVPVALGAPEPA